MSYTLVYKILSWFYITLQNEIPFPKTNPQFNIKKIQFYNILIIEVLNMSNVEWVEWYYQNHRMSKLECTEHYNSGDT